ncbi:MAG: ABC transporter ATP-binding protein [Chloroflexi bacterium]|nr:ABC transporter ATP-binding protein [Chloroflexota bacterium]
MASLPDVGHISLDHAAVRYGEFKAVQDISFDVPSGQFVAIVGPTGCGKSSLLNLAAGLLAPAEGVVSTGHQPVNDVNRDCGYMFQVDALLPWKTALDNVLLGPTLRGVSKPHATAQAHEWLARVGLSGFADRYPHQLSGGQRKRVAMAQALINRPPILLMDEPFSALDVQTRALMEHELLALWQDLRATVLFVTHDLEEAIALSDRVVLLTSGPGARLKGDYPVDLPRPRNVIEARFTPGFGEIYERVWTGLRDEVLASYAQRLA